MINIIILLNLSLHYRGNAILVAVFSVDCITVEFRQLDFHYGVNFNYKSK